MSDFAFKCIELCDKAALDPAIKACGRPLISYNFTSLYLWRHWDRYSWTMVEGVPVIACSYQERNMLLAPLTPDPDKLIAVTRLVMERYRELGRTMVLIELDQELRDLYMQRMPGLFAADDFLPGANYIYNSPDLRLLPGKRYDGKRNHLHHFVKDNPQWQLRPITPEIARLCQSQFRIWNDKLHQGDPELELEARGVNDGLENLAELGCDSGALFAGDRLVAFTFGEALTKDIYCVHVEKGDIDVRGAYQAVNAFFAREYAGEHAFINRAEDMGNEGLRRSKESYHPCRLEHKFILYPATCTSGVWWEI